MPATTSKHRSTSSPKEIPSSSKPKKSKPIQIPGACKRSKVIIVLPPIMNPPALASSPTHRTAPSPHPVLISSSYPGRHHRSASGTSPRSSSSSPPRVGYNPRANMSSSSLPKPRPTFQEPGTSPSSIQHQRPGYNPPSSGSGHGSLGSSPPNPNHFTRVTITGPTMPSGSIPVARSTSVDGTYTRSTVTRGRMMDEDYYSHPAVRAYELQKAVEQARWTRQRQMMNAQKRGTTSGAQGGW